MPEPVSLYARVSSLEQTRNETIKTQIEALERHCQAHGLAVQEVYADDGVTGTIPLEARPEGARLLRDARAGRARTVLVYKLDRLGRTPRHVLNAVAELEATGVTVSSATEPFDTSTASGRFLLTILSGVAGLERDNLLQRSRDGTDRLARLGVWLGGIVPYGYRIEGKKHAARLVIATSSLPGSDLSEPDVVRLIFRLTTEEHLTCLRIADHLNALAIPTSYAIAGQGRRSQHTASLWRAGRIRYMLTNATYAGRHVYGKRSPHKAREVIAREVPAIVSDATWCRAQEVLREHILRSTRNAKHAYLLRGLVVCGVCGLRYCGVPANNGRQYYYRCNGNNQYRGIYGSAGQRCPSRQTSGPGLEAAVWSQAEHWIRHADETIAQLAMRRQVEAGKANLLLAEARHLEAQVNGKQGERDAMLTLYRRGRLTEADLDRQLAAITNETSTLHKRADEIKRRAERAQSEEDGLETATNLLAQCRELLDAGREAETKRGIIEALVSRVLVYTDFAHGGKTIRVEIEPVLGGNGP